MRWFDKKGPVIPASTEADSLRTQLAIERTRYAGELSRLTDEANALRDQLDEFKRERMLRRARELIGIKNDIPSTKGWIVHRGSSRGKKFNLERKRVGGKPWILRL